VDPSINDFYRKVKWGPGNSWILLLMTPPPLASNEPCMKRIEGWELELDNKGILDSEGMKFR
jgi:hypothetical protein